MQILHLPAQNQVAPVVNSQPMQWLLDLTQFYRRTLRHSPFYKVLSLTYSPADVKCWARQLYYLSSEYISALALRSETCNHQSFNQDFFQHFNEESAHPEQLIEWLRKHSFLDADEAPTSIPATLETTSLTAYFSYSIMRKSVIHQLLTLNLVSESVAFDFYSAVIPKLKALKLNDSEYWQIHTELDQEHLMMGFDLIPECTPDSLQGREYAHTVWEVFSLYSSMLDSWSGTFLRQKLDTPEVVLAKILKTDTPARELVNC